MQLRCCRPIKPFVMFLLAVLFLAVDMQIMHPAKSSKIWASTCPQLLRFLLLADAAKKPGLDLNNVETMIRGYADESFVQARVVTQVQGLPVHALTVKSSKPNTAHKVLLLAGVHGNEPLGVTASMQVIESLVRRAELRELFEVTVVIVNPHGLTNKSRRLRMVLTPEEAEKLQKSLADPLKSYGDGSYDVDLNRAAFQDRWLGEYEALRVFLSQQSFDIGLDLHGAPSKDRFFLITDATGVELSTDAMTKPDLGLPLLESLDGRYPGKQKSKTKIVYDMIAKGVAVSDKPNTFKEWMKKQGMKYAASFEYPGAMDLEAAHDGLHRMVWSILHEAAR